MVTASMKAKEACSLEEKLWQPRQHIKKQRCYFETLFCHKGPSNQSYGSFSSHIWMWELDHKESWVPKNWCFWTVVLEKTFESSLGCKEIKPVNLKGNQSWIFIGRTVLCTSNTIQWRTIQYFGHLMQSLTHWKRCWETLMLGKIEGRRIKGP